MKTIENFKNYQEQISSDWLNPLIINYPIIEAYSKELLTTLKILSKTISPDNFWNNLPKIVGIDSKLRILGELLDMDIAIKLELKENDVIDLVEKDFLFFNKELCGYRLNTDTKCSLIFNID
ncbi:DUF7006 family protein [Enterococcus casseliflavus]|uniref:DUF7006 family protein n=1 Tax=Enterococcus casseliflavus TaxID=37734 RepID=UPI001CD78330|nr:hypothetical protein [Enterococcus casseliflavus]